LKDKPADNIWPTPTGRSTWKFMQISDIHVDPDYIEGYNA